MPTKVKVKDITGLLSGGVINPDLLPGVDFPASDFDIATNSGVKSVTVKQSRIESIIADYLSANGYTPGGTGNTNATPTASSVAFTGTQTVGSVLTGTYTYADAEGNAEGSSIKQWYRSDNTSGLNRVAISGATASTYTLMSADSGKFIQFAVTPVATSGTSMGTLTYSSYSAAISVVVSGTTPVTWTNLTAGVTSDANGTLFQNGTATPAGGTVVGMLGYGSIVTVEVPPTPTQGEVVLFFFTGDATANYSTGSISRKINVDGGTLQYNGSAIATLVTGDRYGVRGKTDGTGSIEVIKISGGTTTVVFTIDNELLNAPGNKVYVKGAFNFRGDRFYKVQASGLI